METWESQFFDALIWNAFSRIILTTHRITLALTLFYMGEGIFATLLGFFVKNPFRKDCYLQLTWLWVNLFTKNCWNFEVPKVAENFPILRFTEVTFRNLSIFDHYLT